MARKARFTPREKKSMELLGSNVDNTAVNLLEDLMDVASELQDLLYYKSLGVPTSNAEINKLLALYRTANKEVVKAVKQTTEGEAVQVKPRHLVVKVNR